MIEEIKSTEAARSTSGIILEPITTVIIPEWEGLLEPNSFLKKQGIVLQNRFDSLVLPMLVPVRSVPQTRLTVSRLITELGDDVEIQSEFPHDHLTGWHHFALLIAQQADGEKGPLLTNEGANIFFMLVDGIKYAISVRWYLQDRVWDVAEWLADENDSWEIGDQVFTLSSDH